MWDLERRVEMITHSNMTAIVTMYHGHGRVNADGGLKRRISVPYDHALNIQDNHSEAAKQLCAKFNLIGDLRSGATERGFVFVFADK
jgi:hypothetical protein